MITQAQLCAVELLLIAEARQIDRSSGCRGSLQLVQFAAGLLPLTTGLLRQSRSIKPDFALWFRRRGGCDQIRREATRC